MFRSMNAIGLFLILSLFGSASFAGFWVSANVPDNESPKFESPAQACSWYIDTKAWNYVFSHVSSRHENVVLPAGSFFCYGILLIRPENTWNIGNTVYIGDPKDLGDDNFYNNDAPIPDELKDVIRKSMQRFYGDQVNQWSINAKMLRVFEKWISAVCEKCGAFNFVPRPLGLPIVSVGALANYFLRYGARIITASSSEANYACMLTAAAAMKTEFWAAGNIE